ncbi:MAG: hypothetical protein IJ237_05915 [Oscillospiraceae bacterium]|nr:hypothetical protein [Oscillospiraceae bacterium]
MDNNSKLANLVQFNPNRAPKTAEERREQARKAGIASGEARRKKRALRDLLTDMLGAELSDEDEVKKTLEAMGIEASQEAAIGLAMIQKARKGEVEAARFLRDSSGQKISEGIKLETVNDTDTIDLSHLSNAELTAMIRRAERQNEIASEG